MIDGKMDVKIEFQPLGKGVTISDRTGDVLFPQIKEHLLVSAVKRSDEVLLRRRRQTEPQSQGCAFSQRLHFSQPSQYLRDPVTLGFHGRKTGLLSEGKEYWRPGGFKPRRLRFPQTNPRLLPSQSGLCKKLTRQLRPLLEGVRHRPET